MTKIIKTKPKASLKDLIDSVNWVGLLKSGAPKSLLDHEVSIHFTKKTVKDSSTDKCDFVRIRLGKSVLEKLDWKNGDYIFIATHPDDQFMFLLSKIESKNGFKLGVEYGMTSGRLQFAWRDAYVPVNVSDIELVEYEIHKKQLIFRANPSA